MKHLFSAVSVAVLLTASGSAFAQEQPPPPPPGAAPAPGAPVYAAPTSGQPQQQAAPPGDDGEEKPRFRWGISGFGGKYFVDGTGGGIGGLDVRLGAQINNMFGVYAAPVLMIGGGATASNTATGGGATVSAVVLYGTSVLADLTFSDMFFVAIGPELLSGAAAQASAKADSASGSSAAAKAESGTYFGVEARAGIALGSVKPTRRKAFTIGIDLHTVFTSNVTVIPLLALGYDSF